MWGGGVQAGIDYRVSDRARRRAWASGWNRQNDRIRRRRRRERQRRLIGGGEIESDSYTGSLYASFFERAVPHRRRCFNYTYLDYEFDRPVVLLDVGGDILATAKGDTDADQIGDERERRLRVRAAGPRRGTARGRRLRQTWIDGYPRPACRASRSTTTSRTSLSLVTKLGGEALYAISTAIGVIVPHARITWQHEFENDARNIDARLFVNDDVASPDVLISRTESPDRDYGRVGAGMSAQFAARHLGIRRLRRGDRALGRRAPPIHRRRALRVLIRGVRTARVDGRPPMRSLRNARAPAPARSRSVARAIWRRARREHDARGRRTAGGRLPAARQGAPARPAGDLSDGAPADQDPGRDCEIRGGEYTAYDRASYSTALKVWLEPAKAGDAQAQTYVGEIFEKGLGTRARLRGRGHVVSAGRRSGLCAGADQPRPALRAGARRAEGPGAGARVVPARLGARGI